MNDNYRKSDLAKIHLAKKELGMDDDTYRAMLQNIAGVQSAKSLDAAGRKAVLQHLRTCGMTFKRSSTPRYPGKPHNMDAQLKKIEALLADMQLSWNYANAMAKRMYQVERVAWLNDPKQRQGIITALVRKQKKQQGQG